MITKEYAFKPKLRFKAALTATNNIYEAVDLLIFIYTSEILEQ